MICDLFWFILLQFAQFGEATNFEIGFSFLLTRSFGDVLLVDFEF